ncbi:MAG: hypothetical protein J0L84_06200, partial [Verrucomicrobia bacterium]|nr:hypothetical protein [Verrucomicrobiota bacterium]
MNLATPLRFVAASVWLLALSCSPSVRAEILDSFDAAQRAGWEDADPGGAGLPGGQQGGGRFTIGLPAIGQPFFVSSRKTSQTFELVEGRTVEFRVDMVSGQGPDSFAVLGFIPQANGANSLAGYGIAKSETDILITKGINKYFFNENVSPAVKNENVTLVLNLRVVSGNVVVTGQVLDRDAGNAVLFERIYVDTPAAEIMADGEDSPPAPFVNLVGNFVLYLYADGGQDPAGYQVVYDNAETFVCDEVVLDDFNAAQRSGWTDSDPGGAGLPGGQQGGGVFTFGLPAIGQPFFVNSTKTTSSYELTEGTRHEFSVDLISGQGPDSFAVLAFIPQATGANSLAGYGIAKSETDVLITKGINKYFFNENPEPAVKNNNVRLSLTLTVQGGQVTIRGRVLDLEAAGAVIFDRTYVDTAAADIMADGEDAPPAPFINRVGNVVLYLYADGGQDPAGYQVVLDNLVACAPQAATDEPPRIEAVAPSEGAIFLAPSTPVTFRVVDDNAIPDSGVVVTLNGTDFTTANGLSLGAAGSTRSGTLGGLVADRTYTGQIRVTDSAGATRTAVLSFDTFSSAVRTVEVEDYNFESGGFFNQPVRTAELGGPADNSYTDRVGTADVDFLDTRTAPNGADTMYRTQDPVRMQRALDNRRRDQFNSDLGVYDYEVGDIAAGDWMNYTREFAAGSYEVYLREAVVNLERADSVLEEVTSDPAQPGQTVRLLGTFAGGQTGFIARNIALTDGAGQNRVVLRLSGRTTLRLRHLTADTSAGNRYLNYLAFVPVADAGVQRPAVTSVLPANGSVTATTEARIEAVIQNRDTRLAPETVVLLVNDLGVAPTVSPTDSGARVDYTFPTLPARDAVQRARLIFADSEGVFQTNDWSFAFTYPELDPATRLGGPGPERGLKVRVTQSEENGENSLERAEAQLAANSTIVKVYDTTVTAAAVNYSQNGIDGGTDGYFEGDEAIPGQADGIGTDNYAMEVAAFLDLPAGVTRFGVQCDDGYKLASGLNLGAASPPLAFHNGGPADETFDVVVPVAGVYGFRFVWYERGGGAHVEWFTVDRATGVRTLVNAAGGVASYTSAIVPAGVQALGSSTLGGPYLAVTGAVVDSQAK